MKKIVWEYAHPPEQIVITANGPQSFSKDPDYDIWIGHTNFSISEQDIYKISRIQGVELLRHMSNYRFAISTGKIFDSSKVKLKIQAAICEDKLTKHLKNTYKHWIIYEFPNGKRQHQGTNCEEKFNKILNKVRKLKDVSNGKITTGSVSRTDWE